MTPPCPECARITALWKARGVEIDRLHAARKGVVELLDAKNDQIGRLQEEIKTCRELRKYDRIEIERLRILAESRA